MDDSPGARKLAFALIVLALVGLGAFLLVPGSFRASGSPRGGRAGGGSGPARSLPATAPAAPSTTPASTVPASAGPSAGASTGPAGGTDIYRLMPFTQAALNQAVAVTRQFAADYGTYSYRQDATQYVAPMRGLATPELAATLERGFAAPGVATIRIKQKQVAAASATVSALRAFGPSSMTFVVRVDQVLHAVQGASRLSTAYAVTVERTALGWQATDIQLASAGNS